ncbi:MAG: response regulator transcription factor [Fimbriimonadaceae bacterium]|nr:response regulator transcription factor [Fimbriimonadaceae bacterium]
MRILAIEDDEVIAERLRHTLEKEGFTVDLAFDGVEGLRMATGRAYQLIVLDVMMPKMDGVEVCRELRSQRATVPILMLTARDQVGDKVRGLDSGADDYLAKPFDFAELLARIRALVRRDKIHKTQIVRVADLEIDPVSHLVTRDGEELHLTRREFSLLEALARNQGRTLSRELITEQVWNDVESLSNTVNFHVTSLRKKIDTGREHSLIETIHGVGYRISAGGEGDQ